MQHRSGHAPAGCVGQTRQRERGPHRHADDRVGDQQHRAVDADLTHALEGHVFGAQPQPGAVAPQVEKALGQRPATGEHEEGDEENDRHVAGQPEQGARAADGTVAQCNGGGLRQADGRCRRRCCARRLVGLPGRGGLGAGRSDHRLRARQAVGRTIEFTKGCACPKQHRIGPRFGVGQLLRDQADHVGRAPGDAAELIAERRRRQAQRGQHGQQRERGRGDAAAQPARQGVDHRHHQHRQHQAGRQRDQEAAAPPQGHGHREYREHGGCKAGSRPRRVGIVGRVGSGHSRLAAVGSAERPAALREARGVRCGPAVGRACASARSVALTGARRWRS